MRKQIDSARMYVGGKTEELLGDVMEKEKSLANLRVASKANPWYGDLSRVGVRKQLEDTLKALKSECVDVFYLHGPDAKHDIRETLDEVQKMYEEKKFERFALSNFTAWETMYIHNTSIIAIRHHQSFRDGTHLIFVHAVECIYLLFSF